MCGPKVEAVAHSWMIVMVRTDGPEATAVVQHGKARMILLSKVGCSGIRAVAHRWRTRMILQRRTGGPRVRMAPHLDAVLS